MINQGVTAPDREAFEEWFNAFNIKEMPEYQTIRDFSFAAWQAATAAERERCAKVCDAIAEDKWALYKGRAPYTGKEPGRASDHTQGQSDGADQCAGAIRKGE
jgi:hypothetical protein